MSRVNITKGSVLLCSALLAACGGSSSSSNSTESRVLSGVAADGYLVGAKVCLDLNGNKACDDGEPSATTGDEGVFSITATQAQIDGYPVVLEAIAGTTVDTDFPDDTVASAFILTAPAGATFVSPLTTLVQSKIEEGHTVDNAVAAIQDLLDTDAELLEDYMAKEAAGDEDSAAYARLHDVAQVVTHFIVENSEAVVEAASEQEAEATPEQLFELVIADVVEDIELIADAVDSAIESGEEEVVLEDVIGDLGGSIDIDTTTIDIDEQIAAQKTPADLGELLTSESGLNWVDFGVDGYSSGSPIYDIGGGTITYDAGTKKTTEVKYKVLDGGFVVDSELEADLGWVLSSDGWVLDYDLVAVTSINTTDGSFNLHNLAGNTGDDGVFGGEHIKGAALPVAGQTIAAFIKDEDDNSTEAFFGTNTFSEGAIAYQLTFTATADFYEIWGGGVYHFKATGDYDDDKDALSVADAVVSAAVDPDTVKADPSTLNALSFSEDYAVELVEGDGGVANFYTIDWSANDWSGSATKEGAGTWEKRTVHGEVVYIIIAPAAIQSILDIDSSEHMLFSDHDGSARQGAYIPKGGVEVDGEWVFNATAFGDIKDSYSDPVESVSVVEKR